MSQPSLVPQSLRTPWFNCTPRSWLSLLARLPALDFALLIVKDNSPVSTVLPQLPALVVRLLTENCTVSNMRYVNLSQEFS